MKQGNWKSRKTKSRDVHRNSRHWREGPKGMSTEPKTIMQAMRQIAARGI